MHHLCGWEVPSLNCPEFMHRVPSGEVQHCDGVNGFHGMCGVCRWEVLHVDSVDGMHRVLNRKIQHCDGVNGFHGVCGMCCWEVQHRDCVHVGCCVRQLRGRDLQPRDWLLSLDRLYCVRGWEVGSIEVLYTFFFQSFLGSVQVFGSGGVLLYHLCGWEVPSLNFPECMHGMSNGEVQHCDRVNCIDSVCGLCCWTL
jgi:hypothetical protein